MAPPTYPTSFSFCARFLHAGVAGDALGLGGVGAYALAAAHFASQKGAGGGGGAGAGAAAQWRDALVDTMAGMVPAGVPRDMLPALVPQSAVRA